MCENVWVVRCGYTVSFTVCEPDYLALNFSFLGPQANSDILANYKVCGVFHFQTNTLSAYGCVKVGFDKLSFDPTNKSLGCITAMRRSRSRMLNLSAIVCVHFSEGRQDN